MVYLIALHTARTTPESGCHSRMGTPHPGADAPGSPIPGGILRLPPIWGFLTAFCLAGGALPAQAHPVPKGSHDRTIVVRPGTEAVVVQYRLEVDLYTAIYEDLKPLLTDDTFATLSAGSEFLEAFTRLFGPRLAAGLGGNLDGRPLVFACTKYQQQMVKEPLSPGGVHLRADFVFRAAWQLPADSSHRFLFREGNFAGKPGTIQLTLAAGAGVRLSRGDPLPEGMTADEFARTARARVERAGDQTPEETVPEGADPARGGGDSSLLQLFLGARRTPWMLLLLSALLGAAHALTPGHGKTLVAAYLVGERGTVWHAIVLGLVTTLTHTGIVLLVALGLWRMFPNGISDAERGGIQQTLELGGGALIVGLGFWLLLRRLTGKADHFHLGGSGHHHHHHGPGDHSHAHSHHDHDHAHPHSHAMPGGWWGLVTLGVVGGIVPCWDAIALLVAAVAMNLFWLALPMLLAFSAGLAGILVAIGIVVVRTKALAGKRWEKSRLFRALPLVSSVLVTCLGLWLCYKSVHGG